MLCWIPWSSHYHSSSSPFDLSHPVEKVSSTSNHNCRQGDTESLPNIGVASKRELPLTGKRGYHPEKSGKDVHRGRGCCCPLSWSPVQHRLQDPCREQQTTPTLPGLAPRGRTLLKRATATLPPLMPLHPAGAPCFRKTSNLTLKPSRDKESILLSNYLL